MSPLKPIKVWGAAGPNPPKVAMVLKELGVPIELIHWPISDVKKPEYTAINPNGRLPSIQDPNTGLTLWESGAILDYLVHTYDQEHKLSFPPGSPEFWHTKQWLLFQASGQGPYFGQAAWFKKFHHEKVPSALERYAKEVGRVTGVLESHLSEQAELYPDGDGPWLVGNQITYADIAFISWQQIIATILTKEEFDPDQFTHVKEWIGKMSARPHVKQVMEDAFRIHGGR